MNISEQEKNRIRGLHKNNSTSLLVETTDCKTVARDGFTACDKHTEKTDVTDNDSDEKDEALKKYKACVQEVFKEYDTCKK